MKWFIWGLLPLLLISCGVKTVSVDFQLPEVDRSSYIDSYFSQGWEQLQRGNSNLAIKNFRKSQVAEDKINTGIGYAYIEKGKYRSALENFFLALQQNPGNQQADVGLGIAYEKMDELQKAFQHYGKLISKYPDNPFGKLRYDNLKKTFTDLNLKKAEEYRSANNREKYIRFLEEASYYSPELTSLIRQIADFYFSENNLEKAALNYEAFLEKNPSEETPLVRLAEIYEKKGQMDLALLMYDQLLKIKPGDRVFEDKKREIRQKFQEQDLPQKFKNIFFKEVINREEVAALLGYFFTAHLPLNPTPEIITDIDRSFAKKEIITLCTLGIMKTRPDHTFDRFTLMDRASFAYTLDALLKTIEKQGLALHFTPSTEPQEPGDIPPLHRNYGIIKFLINAQIMKLDPSNNFNPTLALTPNEAIAAIKKVLNSIESE